LCISFLGCICSDHINSEEGGYTGAGFWTGIVNGGPQDGASFNFSDVEVEVFDNFSSIGDSFRIVVPTPGGSTTFFYLDDADATTFSNDSLPSMLTLADFETRQIFLGPEIGVSVDQFQYTFQSISAPTVIPLPSAAWLFGSALGFVAWYRGKKTNRIE